MSSDPLQNAWENWAKNPTPDNARRLLSSSDKILSTVVKSNQGLSEALVRAKAKNLILKAAQTYDPAAGTKFSTHAYNHVKPLTIRGHTMLQGVDVSRYQDEISGRYRSFLETFVHDNHREPSLDEVVDGVGVSPKKAKNLMASGMGYEMPEGGLAEGTLPGLEEADSSDLNLWLDYVYMDLPETHKVVLDYRLGRNGRPPLKIEEIAKRMEISPGMVHKITDGVAKKILGGIQESEKLRVHGTLAETLFDSEDTLEDPYEQRTIDTPGIPGPGPGTPQRPGHPDLGAPPQGAVDLIVRPEVPGGQNR
jgi:DNA-directed RNA polymerase specialized sigma subunit